MSTPFDRLKTQLLTSGLQQTNNALFQVIDQLINLLTKFQNSILGATSSSGGSSSLANQTYITETDETGVLPNSRKLLAGTGVTFDDTIPGQRTVGIMPELKGYWAPLTDGDLVEMDLIANNGEAIMVWVPTP